MMESNVVSIEAIAIVVITFLLFSAGMYFPTKQRSDYVHQSVVGYGRQVLTVPIAFADIEGGVNE